MNIGPVLFRQLQTRLVAYIRGRVQNGEISERGLARVTGISQPHLHNVLSGVRVFSIDMADQILQRLRIDVVDLIQNEESGHTTRGYSDARAIPMLAGRIGPVFPFPRFPSEEHYPFAPALVGGIEAPAAARLAVDTARTAVFVGPGVVLLDMSASACLQADEQSFFALDLGEGGTIAMICRTRRHWSLRGDRSAQWRPLPQADRDPLAVIRGRVRALVREF